MRYWRVLINASDGRQYSTRADLLSESRAILLGDQPLPAGMACNLYVAIPSRNKLKPAGFASLQAEVNEVIFCDSGVRLGFRIKSLSNEAKKLIESQKTKTG